MKPLCPLSEPGFQHGRLHFVDRLARVPSSQGEDLQLLGEHAKKFEERETRWSGWPRESGWFRTLPTMILHLAKDTIVDVLGSRLLAGHLVPLKVLENSARGVIVLGGPPATLATPGVEIVLRYLFASPDFPKCGFNECEAHKWLAKHWLE